MTIAGSGAVASLCSYTRDWLARLRAVKGYNLAVRVLGSVWFLLLGLAAAGKVYINGMAIAAGHFSPNAWPTLISSTCLFLFYFAVWLAIIIRPLPAARISGVLPLIIAFTGTYLPWTIMFLAPHAASAGPHIASAALLMIGTSLMVVTICYLGRSFSIVPEARKLVRTGPYAIVRNPLYLAEEIAILGTLLQYFSLVTLLLFLAQCGLQIGRILYEENLLRRTFSDYNSYARMTSRLLPRVW